MRTGQESAAQGVNPVEGGRWEAVQARLPVTPLHAALVHTGHLLFIGPSGETDRGSSAYLWHREQASSSRIWDFPADFSVGAICPLPDGRLLLVGGTKDDGAVRLAQTYLFDPHTEDWLRVNDMPGRGACPTLIGLGDGRVLAVGGASRAVNHAYEKAGGWSPASSQEIDWPLYPQLTLLSNGSIFFSGQHFGGRSLVNPGLLRPDGRFQESPEEHIPADFRFSFREQGGTVVLPPAQDERVLVVSGGSPLTTDVHLMDFRSGEPQLRTASPLHAGRAGFNTVLLPDRTVLVCGGRGAGRDSPTPAAEIYDPAADRWTVAASHGAWDARHSSAILLPDGRVLMTGSASEQDLRPTIYHPPYLFRGSRPRVEAAPGEIFFGEPFLVATSDADIRWMNLLRPGASTAGFDPGQRLIDLPFESKGRGLLQAFVPDNANIAPPGWYLFFLVNHAGIPSEGKWLHLSHGSGTYSVMAELAESDPWPQPADPPDLFLRTLTQERPGTETVFWTEDVPDRVEPEDFRPEPLASAPPVPEARENAIPAVSGPPPVEVLGTPGHTVAVPPAPRQPLVKPPSHPAETLADPVGEPDLSKDQSILREAEEETDPLATGARWWTWTRPALVIGSGGLLILGMLLEIFPLRVGAALLFLLFGPGMALVGLFRPHDWLADIGLAIGTSIAVETILTLSMLYMGVWSFERSLFILLGMSLIPAAVQLVRAAMGWPREPPGMIA